MFVADTTDVATTPAPRSGDKAPDSDGSTKEASFGKWEKKQKSLRYLIIFMTPEVECVRNVYLLRCIDRHNTEKKICCTCVWTLLAVVSMQRYGSLQQFWLSSLIPDRLHHGANICTFTLLLVILSVG